jgi:hypothetical protein
MKKMLVGALIAGSLVSFGARAQQRAGSAALGAVSGAVVPGPVGAAAGALIGYTAGPSITRWGMQRSSSRSGARHATQFGPVPQRQAAAVAGPPSAVRTSPLRPRESRHHRFRGSNRAPARDARGATRYLTRRANHLHIFIIARIQRPAPGNRPRVFSIRSVVPRADRCVLRHVFRAKHPEGPAVVTGELCEGSSE